MLTGDTTGVSEYDLRTRAKVALDELRELLGKNGSFEQDADAIILAAAKEAESAIVRGRTEFPESAEMLATESELLDLLNKAPKALATLERAFKLNPRQDWLAIRLAKRYETEDNRPKAIDVMQRCLRENPSSRSAHLQLAHILRKGDGDQKNILGHLRQSFSAGDNNFEGQFWYARELFIENNLADANALFDSLNERAPGRFRTRPSAILERQDGRYIDFFGSVLRKEEGYAFIKLLDFSLNIFSSRSESTRLDWDNIRTSSQITGNLAFNRKGAQVVKLTTRRT